MEPTNTIVNQVASQYVDGKQYQSTNEVLLSALQLWVHREDENEDEVLKKHLKKAQAEADAGLGTVTSSFEELASVVNGCFTATE